MSLAESASAVVFSRPPATLRGRPLVLFLAGIGGSPRQARPLGTHLPGLDFVTVTSRPAAVPAAEISTRAAGIAEAVAGAGPILLVGHSFGAIVGFEVARLLERQRPECLAGVVLAAQAAPHLMRRYLAAELSDERVIGYVTGGEPLAPALRAAPDFVAALVRHWRAEYALCSAYRPHRTPISADLHVWIGAADPATVRPADVMEWQRYSTGRLTVRTFPGAHDFLFDDPPATASHIVAVLDGGTRS